MGRRATGPWVRKALNQPTPRRHQKTDTVRRTARHIHDAIQAPRPPSKSAARTPPAQAQTPTVHRHANPAQPDEASTAREKKPSHRTSYAPADARAAI